MFFRIGIKVSIHVLLLFFNALVKILNYYACSVLIIRLHVVGTRPHVRRPKAEYVKFKVTIWYFSLCWKNRKCFVFICCKKKKDLN